MKKDFKKPEFKLLKEFKAFITKGNVVDLAVGMIIGAAFTAIVTALVNNIFKPLINAIPMGDLQGLITMLVAKNAEGLTAAECAKQGIEFVADMSKSVYIDWGAFIMAIINFLITALVLFALVKLINMVRGGFTGLTRDTKFLESLTPEEQRLSKRQTSPKPPTICSAKSATFSKRNRLTRQPPFSKKKPTKNNRIKTLKPLVRAVFLLLSVYKSLFLFDLFQTTISLPQGNIPFRRTISPCRRVQYRYILTFLHKNAIV